VTRSPLKMSVIKLISDAVEGWEERINHEGGIERYIQRELTAHLDAAIWGLVGLRKSFDEMELERKGMVILQLDEKCRQIAMDFLEKSLRDVKPLSTKDKAKLQKLYQEALWRRIEQGIYSKTEERAAALLLEISDDVDALVREEFKKDRVRSGL